MDTTITKQFLLKLGFERTEYENEFVLFYGGFHLVAYFSNLNESKFLWLDLQGVNTSVKTESELLDLLKALHCTEYKFKK